MKVEDLGVPPVSGAARVIPGEPIEAGPGQAPEVRDVAHAGASGRRVVAYVVPMRS